MNIITEHTQTEIECAQYTINAWTAYRQEVIDLSTHWEANSNVQDEIKRHLVMINANITVAESQLAVLQDQLEDSSNKVITLSSEQYDKIVELIQEELNVVTFQLHDENFAVTDEERPELKEQLDLLGNLSTTIYEQCE